MVTLNELLADAVVNLYEVQEQWHTIAHDSPSIGRTTELTKASYRIGVYSTWAKAKAASDEFRAAKAAEWKGLDKFDRLRIAVEEHGIPQNAEDYSFRFVIQPQKVSAKDIEEKDRRTYWDGTEIL